MIHQMKTLTAKIQRLFKRRSAAHEMDEEINTHIRLLTERYIEQGMAESEAVSAARRQFGNATLLKEANREMRGIGIIDTLVQDLRYGARMLRRNPVFTFIVVLTLALGIGANTAIFSVVNGVLLKSLPFPDAERLLVLHEASKTTPVMSVSYPNLLDWRRRQTVFENLTAYSNGSLTLTGVLEPERLSSRHVTANFFATLKVQPALGRAFTEEEDSLGGQRVVILSHKIWLRYFNGDPQMIGRTITLNGAGYTVVGVTPAEFDFYGRRNQNDLFLPMGQMAGADYMRDRDAHPGIYAIGRLKSRVTVEGARAAMKVLATRLAEQYPKENTGHTIELRSFLEDYIGEIHRPLWMLQIAVGLVLLIACANVANLLLARANSRRREIAMRMALGAGRRSILRQLLTESLLLSSLGGALAMILAVWGVRLLLKLDPDALPRLDDVTIDWRVLGFTLLATLLTGVVFSLAPALEASKTDVNETLKDGGRNPSGGGRRLRSALVVAEVALSLVLLIAAGLLTRSFWRVLQVDPGFDPKNVLTMRLQLPNAKYDQVDRKLAFYHETLERVSALPGVQQVSLTDGFPLVGSAITIGYSLEGQPAWPAPKEQQCIVQSVSPAYHEVFGIRLLVGRYFAPQDNPGSQPAVIVDETFAQKHFPALSPAEVVGKQVSVGGDNLPWREIIGVVRQVRHDGREEAGRPEIYRLWSQMGPGWVAKRMFAMNLVVKTNGNPLSFVALIKREIQAIDHEQPIGNIKTMERSLDESVAERRFILLLVGLFGLLALLLGAVGISCVMAYTISQRTHEIGVRMALGAERRHLLRLVVGQGMRWTLIGVAIGLAGALALTRMIKTLLFDVSATDPSTFTAVALLLIVVALLACYLPARRVTQVDPVVALRSE
jgi:putative ABC transport system permease protein